MTTAPIIKSTVTETASRINGEILPAFFGGSLAGATVAVLIFLKYSSS